MYLQVQMVLRYGKKNPKCIQERLQYKYHVLQAVVLPLAPHGNVRGTCENLSMQAPRPQTNSIRSSGYLLNLQMTLIHSLRTSVLN